MVVRALRPDRLRGVSPGAVVLCLLAVAHAMVPPAAHPLLVGTAIVIGAGSIVAGIVRQRPARGSGWRLFAVGLVWYASWDVAYLVADALPALRSRAELAWSAGLLGVPVVLAGVRRALASGSAAVDWESRLDAAIVALVVGFVGWQAVVLLPDGGPDWGYRTIGAAVFWIAGLIMFGLLLSRALAGRAGPSVVLLGLAVPLTVMTSVVYWIAEHDVAWVSAPIARPLMVLAYAAGAAATWHPSLLGVGASPDVRGPDVVRRTAIVAVGVCVVPIRFALGMLGVAQAARPDPVAGLIGAAITVAALARVALTLHARAAAEAAIGVRERRFRALVEHAYDACLIMDAQLHVVWGTANAGQVTGRDLVALQVVGVLADVHPEEHDDVRRRFTACAATPGAEIEGRVRLRTTDGAVRTADYRLVNRLDDDAVRGLVLNYRDTTDEVAALAALERTANDDGLTGLSNRGSVTRALEHLVACDRAPTVLFVDLDRFKRVNDTLGHEAGDRLLVAIADRLLAAVPAEGVVGRLGGDEFLVVLPGPVNEEAAAEVAASVCAAVAAPVQVDGRRMQVSCSVGVATWRPGSAVADLLRDADDAMYRAKSLGRDAFAVHDDADRLAATRTVRLADALRQALAEGWLVLHHQPVLAVAAGQISASEALLRWAGPPVVVEPDGPARVPTPAELVDVAERTGLIMPLGDWVIAQACRDLAAIHRALGHTGFGVGVNVSAEQLRRPTVVDVVAHALQDAGAPASSLSIELTETVLVDHVPGATDALRRVQELGCHLGMDDFGTGASSLRNLGRVPFEFVKIDRGFVAGVGVTESAEAVVSAVIGMGHGLGLQVVAEGVETPEQEALLRAMGCDRLQGFLLGRPMPLADLVDLLQHDAAADQDRGVEIMTG